MGKQKDDHPRITYQGLRVLGAFRSFHLRSFGEQNSSKKPDYLQEHFTHFS